MKYKNFKLGKVNVWMIVAIISLMLVGTSLLFAGWYYIQARDANNMVESKIKEAVNIAKLNEYAANREEFQKEMKNPKYEFVGPEDYGRVSFYYPKTWSVYVSKDGSDRGDYKAYFNPKIIPPVDDKANRFAVRLEIINKDYDALLLTYRSKIKNGKIRSEPKSYNGNAAVRLDGEIEDKVEGSAVLMSMRDKTIRISTDSKIYNVDYEEVLSSIKFVK